MSWIENVLYIIDGNWKILLLMPAISISGSYSLVEMKFFNLKIENIGFQRAGKQLFLSDLELQQNFENMKSFA
jgi:hypothetical protein